MCECASAALEQVAGDRLVYILGGFGCAVVAIRFALGELLWMKKMKLHISILYLLDFLAALSQGRTHKFVMYRKESTHYLPLRVCQEIHPTKTLFECPICANPKPPLHKDGDHIQLNL
ncbi:hypothetical protein RHSIM_Rhsim01G0043500 [Rhododendron simsii]|uniref:Uncharacterized protein n=1 Tax=Rhododendron simsii TaxID=118357 RepID=A0A834HID3_RHOSS|nr:hypothetical protein RHSIM_Rhsim01G0043500 [Rhododendron simsii]